MRNNILRRAICLMLIATMLFQNTINVFASPDVELPENSSVENSGPVTDDEAPGYDGDDNASISNPIENSGGSSDSESSPGGSGKDGAYGTDKTPAYYTNQYTAGKSINNEPNWDAGKFVEAYNDPDIYGVTGNALQIGLQKVNYGDMTSIRQASDKGTTAPDAELAAQRSGDIINVAAGEQLYGMKAIVDQLSVKQITVRDWNTIMWSFVVSQFATPYSDSLLDVLEHPLFKQMIEQDLKISSVASTLNEGVHMDDVFIPDKVVTESVAFADIAENMRKHLKYNTLYSDIECTKQVQLWDFLTSPEGTVYYVADRRSTLAGASLEDMWKNRGNIYMKYTADDIETKELAVPVYVQSNVSLIYNQINIGSFLHGQSNENDDSSATFEAIVGGTEGATGSMGSNNMYIDSYGNICVHHDGKFKIVLCNAQNSIFNNIEEPKHVFNLEKTAESLPNAESYGIPEATVQSSESMNLYNKPFLTTYSRHISTNAWDADKDVYFTGDSILADFPGYVQYKRGIQNSHRNQVIMYKMPVIMGEDGGSWWQGGAANYPLIYGMPDDPVLNGGVEPKKLTIGKADEMDEDDDEAAFYKQYVLSSINTAKNWWTRMTTGNGFVWNRCWGNDPNVAKAQSYSSLYAFVQAHVDEGKFPYAYNNITKALFNMKNGNLKNADVWDMTNVMMTFGLGCSHDYRIPNRFYQGDSKLNGDGEWVSSADKVDVTTGEVEADNFTFGVTLVDTLDYGQNWSLIADGSGDDAGIQGEWTLPGSGLFKPRYKITTTLKKACYKELETILINKGLTTTEAASQDKDVKKWLRNHAAHAFIDNCYMFLRDTRVTDRWVDYGIDDIALIAYTWLNYYLVNTNLYSRELFRTGYEDPFITKFRDISLMTAEGLDENGNPTDEAIKNGTYSIVKGQKYGSDIYGSPYGDDGLLFGPYKELHGSETECDYDLYPDTAPAPACVPVPGKTGTYDNHLTYNAFDLIMALYCNTNADKNKVSDQPQTAEVPVVDKNDILEGIWRFIKYPVSTAVSWMSGVLQSIHRSVSSGTFGEFFSVSWITKTDLWKTVFQYYFIAITCTVLVISIYQFIQYLLRRDYSFMTLLKRFIASFLLVLIPVSMINYLVMGMDSWGNRMIDTAIMKAAVAETGAIVSGKANANRLFEYNYQLFREQFNSIEDTVGQYTYRVPRSYYPTLGTYNYDDVKLQDSVWAVAYTSNQGKTKWYDYRGFVPVNKERYSQNLYFYFYDYIKWQFLQYCAVTNADNSSVQIQDRAREFRYGTTYDGDLATVREQCLDDNVVGVPDTIKDYIAAQETLLMQSKGDFAIMINDPIYIYGESFEQQNLNRWGEYNLQDLFGLGYLLTDKYASGVQWEPSDELFKYPGWQTMQKDPTLKKVTASNGEVYFQNQGPVIQDLDEQTLAKGMASRQEQVFASKTALFNQVNFNKDVHKSVPMSALEQKLISLNAKIYKDIQDMVTFFPGTTPNDAFISLAALKCSFEFTRAFGNSNFLYPRLEPVGFENTGVSFDSVLKGIYAKSVEDLLNGQEIMYIILDNSGGFGLLTCVMIIVLDIMAFVVIVTRNILVMAIFVFAVYLCIVNYVVKRDYRNKTILGMSFQILGLFASHTLACKGMSLVAKYSGSSQSLWFLANPGKTYSNSNTSLWMDIFTALILIMIFFADMVVHLALVYIIFKDFNNFGGNIVANKLQGALNGLKGRFDKSEGKMSKYEKAAFKEMRQQRKEKIRDLRRQKRAIAMDAAKSTAKVAAGVSAGVITGGTSVALAALRAGSKVKDGLQQSAKIDKLIRRMKWDNFRSKLFGESGINGVDFGSDTRFGKASPVQDATRLNTTISDLRRVHTSRRSSRRSRGVVSRAHGGSKSRFRGRSGIRSDSRGAPGSSRGGSNSGRSGGNSAGAYLNVTADSRSRRASNSTGFGDSKHTPRNGSSTKSVGRKSVLKDNTGRVASVISRRRSNKSNKLRNLGSAAVVAGGSTTGSKNSKPVRRDTTARLVGSLTAEERARVKSLLAKKNTSGSSTGGSNSGSSKTSAGSNVRNELRQQVNANMSRNGANVRANGFADSGRTPRVYGRQSVTNNMQQVNDFREQQEARRQEQLLRAQQETQIQAQQNMQRQVQRSQVSEQAVNTRNARVEATRQSNIRTYESQMQDLRDRREQLVRDKFDNERAYNEAKSRYEDLKAEASRQKDAKYRMGIASTERSKSDPKLEEELRKAQEAFSRAERANMELQKVTHDISLLQSKLDNLK